MLDDYVGLGNALDAYVRAVIEARHRRRTLIIKSPILRNGVRCIRIVAHATQATGSAALVRRDDLSRNERMCLASSHQGIQAPLCVLYDFWLAQRQVSTRLRPIASQRFDAARQAILRELLPRREHGELLKRFLPILEKAFVGASVEEAVAPSQRYAVALHLRTLDFIEGKNATDAAAFDWLHEEGAIQVDVLSAAPDGVGIGLFAQSKSFSRRSRAG